MNLRKDEHMGTRSMMDDTQATAESGLDGPTRTAPKFIPLRVVEVRRETEDSVSVAFDTGPAAEQFRFVPGQYVTLRRYLNGQDVRRCYSISSGTGDGELRVVIKRVPDGMFSSYANSDLKLGEVIDVMTPSGSFGVMPQPGIRHRYVAFAVGSGITPVISIIRSVLATEDDSHFTLLYGNQTSNSIIFKDALENLKDLYMNRFSLVHFLSREVSQLPLHSGRIEVDKLEALARLYFSPSGTDAVFLCGPGSMVSSLRNGLVQIGLDVGKIKSELFTPLDNTNIPHRHVTRVVESQGLTVEVTTVLNGVGRHFRMKENEANIVDAAALNGILLPYSCKGGMCSTCRARVTEGTVSMAANYALEPAEIAQGYVLACQAHPTSSKVTLDFDQV